MTLISDRAYEKRLKKHYTMVKAKIKAGNTPSSTANKNAPSPGSSEVRCGRRS